jgi:flavorubredoxin
MMPSRVSIKKHVETVRSLAPTLIAPSHGPLHNKPAFILDAYQDWISDTVKNEVVIPYVSMHGSTAAMVDYFVKALEGKGIKALPFNLEGADIGDLAMALVDASTIIIGSPTVLAGPHPKAVFAAVLANALRPKTKYVSVIGSYGWGGKTVEQLKGLLSNLKVEVLDPVMAKGYPKEADFKGIDKLVEAIYNRKQ